MRNSVAYMPNVMQVAIRQAAENCAVRNSSTGNSGERLFNSTATNPTTESAETTTQPTTGTEDQPQRAPSMKPKAKVASAMTASNCPGMSILRLARPRDPQIAFQASRQASAAKGTVTMKTPRQPIWSTISPPVAGPTSQASPLQPAQMPMARARSPASV